MIKIFDTTLRDGEQSPGFAMNLKQKLLFAGQLEKLGVDVIEAGFPVASPEDFEAVRQIAEALSKPEICALARCHEKDIERAAKALEKATKPRIHVFIATSDIHLKHKLKITPAQAIEKAVAAVRFARSFTARVDFSPEDATRSNPQFLIDILQAVIEAGADTLNIPDTVGYLTPHEYGKLIQFLHQKVVGIEKTIISTHCHDDLGLAVANSLHGVLNGAKQVECTINGIGERAGNASLEEIVMALKTRKDVYQTLTHIDTTQLAATSHLLTQITGQKIPLNKAIVGKNAFAHGSGIHQHGMVSERSTYEIMKPEDVGITSTSLFLSKHSGRHGLAHRLAEIGIKLETEKLDSIFLKFKKLADKKKHIYDEDLIRLATEEDFKQKYELIALHVETGTNQPSRTSVSLRIDEQITHLVSEDYGPISALFKGLSEFIKLSGKLIEFNIQACSPEEEAVGWVQLSWQEEDKTWLGNGSDLNIVIAAAKAFINMINNREIKIRLSP